MSWNYRIVKFMIGSDPIYEMAEVYYDANGEPEAWGPASVTGDTPEEIQEVLDMMLRGAAKPVIDKWLYGDGEQPFFGQR